MTIEPALHLIHVAAGFGAIGVGIVALLARKGGQLHAKVGVVYFGLVTVTCLFAALVAMCDLSGLWPFIPVSIATYAFACAGFWARGRRDRRGLMIHVIGLTSSFSGMLIAFFVTNFQRLTGISGVPFLFRLFPLQFMATCILIFVAVLVYRGRLPRRT